MTVCGVAIHMPTVSLCDGFPCIGYKTDPARILLSSEDIV